MKTIEELSYAQARKLHERFFTLGYLNTSVQNKLALISLVCNVTFNLNKKRNEVEKLNCYDVICKIGKDFPDEVKSGFFKSLGAVCDDMMYGCDTFPDFGIKLKEQPKTIKNLLNEHIPFLQDFLRFILRFLHNFNSF